MDDIKARLQESSEACFKSYEAWDANKETQTREDLQEAIHELRKVASRLEIEITLSERAKVTGKPIPIPSHRSNSKSKGPVESILPDQGNTEGSHSAKKEGGARRSQRSRRTTSNRKSNN